MTTSIVGPIVGVALVLLFAALWVYALISAIRNERLSPSARIAWVLVIIFVNLLGWVLYLIFAPRRPRRPGVREQNLHDLQRRKEQLEAQARVTPGKE